jgi:hypothetical protein
MLRSRNAVKDQIRKQGLKLSHYTAREITSWAMVYSDDHHETLIPEAIASARAMILRGDFGKRAQRAALERFAQTQKPQNSMTSTVQMSGAK